MSKPFWKTRIRDWGIINALQRTVNGENKTGEFIHGVLDISPIPNEPIGKFLKAIISGNMSVAKAELKKIVTVRHIVSIVAAVLVVSGKLDLETVNAFISVFGDLMESLKGVGL
jgi:hypothetical protein